jgi:hypothetical protein
MTKFFALLLTLSLIFAASCSTIQAPTPAPEPEYDETALIKELEELDMMNRILINDFCLTANFPFSLSTVIEDKYVGVNEWSATDYNSLKESVESTYCSEYSYKLLNNYRNLGKPLYLEVNGQLVGDYEILTYGLDDEYYFTSESNKLLNGVDNVSEIEILDCDGITCHYKITFWSEAGYIPDFVPYIIQQLNHTAVKEDGKWKLVSMYDMYENDVIY